MSDDALLLYHGGRPGLRVGDILTGGHTRRMHEGCPTCAAREAGRPTTIDPPAEHVAVYATTSRLYALHYASLWGRGDLYRVRLDPAAAQRSSEDTIESWHAPSAVIVAVLDRAVLLTAGQRRALMREWSAADAAAHGVGADDALFKFSTNRWARSLGLGGRVLR